MKEVSKLIIVIPFEGRIRTVIRSPYLLAKRTAESRYSLTGDSFQMTEVSPDQVVILPDEASVAEGQMLTDELMMQALPMESFISTSMEEVMPELLGLVLRAAVADGRITDAELLRVAPALEGRQWQPGIEAAVGDVYTFGLYLWRCIQAHTTQDGWPPDLTPALWRKVEIIPDDEVRVWAAGIDYVTGDVLAYPDKGAAIYECLQGHTSQEGWEPPNVPALWKEADS